MPNQFYWRKTLTFLLAALALAGSAVGDEPKRIASSRELPIEEKPIDYWGPDSQNPIARLARKIETKELTLDYSEHVPLCRPGDIPSATPTFNCRPRGRTR